MHVIDPGVDTGPIVAQASIAIDPSNDTYRTLVVKQYLAGLHLMAEALRGALEGTLTTHQRQDLESRQWFSPTLADHVRFNRRLRALKRSSVGVS